MPAFAIVLRVTQSADGKTITVHDDSVYGNNTDGVVLQNVGQRVLIIKDGYGNTLFNQPFTPLFTEANFTITKDYYLNITAAFGINSGTNSGGMVTATINYLSTAFYDLAQVGAAKNLDCKCKKSNSICDNSTKSIVALKAAKTFALYGKAVECQTSLDAANTLITTLTPCH